MISIFNHEVLLSPGLQVSLGVGDWLSLGVGLGFGETLRVLLKVMMKIPSSLRVIYEGTAFDLSAHPK